MSCSLFFIGNGPFLSVYQILFLPCEVRVAGRFTQSVGWSAEVLILAVFPFCDLVRIMELSTCLRLFGPRKSLYYYYKFQRPLKILEQVAIFKRE